MPSNPSSMDLDAGLEALDLGGTPPIDPRLEDALEVYRTTWNEFYNWERDLCRNTIKDCERPPDYASPTNTHITSTDLLESDPLEFIFDPPSDAGLEFFTVEEFDTLQAPERYSTLLCPDHDNNDASAYHRYEFCTPASYNYMKEDINAANYSLPFIPYADDISFKIEEYLEDFARYGWQEDFADPDWETIELEVASRLVGEHGFTLAEVDQLKILRKSRINRSSGLLWDTAQR
ncbi:hypothetical protein DXG01_010878 [Tephrocybe rancida]|nr:hypothetical protein DXG01_010878 [Tephrocybe rancida]